ncbi:MAG: PKD domain-containing protein [Bacteroidota bacterium]
MVAANGCDSIINLTLNIGSLIRDTLEVSICEGTTYNFGGTPLSVAGTYADTLTTANCDSISTVNLSFLSNSVSAITASICTGTSYNFNGTILTTAGSYADTLVAANGCDSIVNLTLNIDSLIRDTLEVSICEGTTYDFGGRVLSLAGTYSDTLTTANCDSISTINLSLLANPVSAITASICTGTSYDFNGTILTTGGIYADTLMAANGCDSIITLNLMVTPLPNLEITNSTQQLCLNQSLDLSTIISNTDGTITYHGALVDAENGTLEISSNVTGQGTTTYYIRATSILDSSCYVVEPIFVTDENCRYDLALNKTLASGQLSGVRVGDTIYYSINVFNEGDYDAYDIDVVDYVPQGLTFTNTLGWNIIDENTVTRRISFLAAGASDSLRIGFSVDDGFDNTRIINFAELTGATNSDGSPFLDEDSIFDNLPDEISTPDDNPNNEDDDSFEIIEVGLFDLALTKRLAQSQAATVEIGEDINYEICVINQGNITGYNIIVADHIPNGLVLSTQDNNNWTTISNDLVTKTIPGPINPGEQACVQIVLTLNSGDRGANFRNIAEIAGNQDEQGNNIKDEDSTPDFIEENEESEEDDFGSAIVTLPSCPVVAIEPSVANICQGTSIQLRSDVGDANSTYTWTPTFALDNPFIADPVANPLVSTTYIVKVENGLIGCADYDTVRVNVFDVPNPRFQATSVCQGEPTIFTDQSATYTTMTGWFWDFGDGIGTSTQQNPNYVYPSPGRYQVKLITESTNGCQDSIIQQVIVYPNPQASASIKGDTICIGACAELKAQGGTTFQWTPSATLNHDTCFNPVACPTETTTYTVTVTNDFGCATTDEVTLTVIPGPTIDVTMTNVTECGKNDGKITIDAIGLGSNYEYSIDGGLTFYPSNIFNDLPASSYLVVVRGGGCLVPYAGNPVIIGEGLAPMITSIPVIHPDCNADNGVITINASGTDLRYSINGGINFYANNEFTDLAGGTYYIAVSANGGNCITYYPPVTLVQPTSPSIIDVRFTHPTNCGKRDGSITIIADGVGGLEYGLDDGTMTIWQSSSNFINVPAGTYTIYVRNGGNTCITPYTLNNIVLEELATPILTTVAITQPTDCGGNNGSINIAATAGSANLEYSIDGGINWENSGLFENLPPNTYNVFIRNKGGTCVVASSNNPIRIDEPIIPQITEVVTSNPDDCGINNGRIEITAEGESSNLIYSIDAGVTWQESSIFSDLSGGIYNIRVANADESCSINYPTIELIAPLPSVITNVATTTGCEPSNRTISITAASETSLEYSIDGGATFQSSNNFINLDFGTYNIYTRNVQNNCLVAFENNPVLIESPATNNGRFIDYVQAGDPTTCGVSDGFIEVNAIGGNLTYSIDGGITYSAQNTFNDLPPGKYWVFVKEEATGCEEDYLFNPVELIGVDAPEISAVTSTNPSDCKANDGTISIAANGDGFLQYSLDGTTWSNGSTFINLLPGLYNAWVRYDDESCRVPYANNPIVITAPTAPIITECFGTNPTDCGINDGTLLVIAKGGQGDLRYSIDGGTTWQASNLFTDLAAGIYSVAVANEDETCRATHPLCELVAPQPPILNEVLAVNPSICGEDNGSITILADGNGALEYSIDGGNTWNGNSFFGNLAAGNYDIAVRNATDNCVVESGITTLEAPAAPTVVVGMENESTCTGNSLPVSITISENIAQYTILGVGGYLNVKVAGATLSFDAFLNGVVNNYIVTLENADGCSVTEEFAIFQAANPEADFIVHNPTCAATDVAVEFTGTASPGATLTWDLAGATLISSSAATSTAPAGATLMVQWPTPGGKKISLAINDGGCEDRKVQSINVNKLPFADAGPDVTICDGECVQLNGLGNGAQYQWSPAIGLSATDIPNPMACPPSTTTYQLLVMGSDGCMVIDEVTVTVAGELTVMAGPDQSICAGESIQLEATGGVSYVWTPSTGLSNPNIANPIAKPQTVTTYTVEVTNASGCIGTDEVVVSVTDAPIVEAGDNQMICMGENTMLSATGGVRYEWNPATGLSATNIPNPIATPTTTTTYIVVGTDANGCSATDEVTIIVGGNAQANAGANVNICVGASTQLNASGGVTYNWHPTVGLDNPNVANPTASPNTTTTYTVTVTNQDGCVSTDQVTVSVNGLITANAGPDQTVCRGSTVFLNATGGSNYIWSPTTGLSNPTVANPTATVNQTTTYTVTVTNQDGCVSTDQVTIFVNDNISVGISPNTIICDGQPVALSATGGITYSWSPTVGLSNPNIANPIANPAQTTTYCVTTTNAQGCLGTACTTITVKDGPTVVGCPDRYICDGGSVRLVVNGGVSWVWSPATGLDNPNSPAPNASPSVTTTYTVTGTDAFGCSSSDVVVVFVNEGAGIDAGPDQTSCAGGTVQLAASGGVTYDWSPTFGLSNPNIANPTLVPIATTTYTVASTTAEGCIATDQVTVFVSNPATVDAGLDKTICSGESVQLNGTGGTNYSWRPTTGLSNPNIANPIATPTSTTVYTVTTYNSNGCSSSDNVVIGVNEGIVVTKNIVNPGCCNNDGSIILGTSGINGHLSYNWSPNVSSSHFATNLPAGNYKITISDVRGCQTLININLIQTCNSCTPIAEESTVCVAEGATTGEICLPVPLEDIHNYQISANGQIIQPNHGCAFQNLTAYSYALLSGKGSSGPYKIDGWQVNGLTYTGMVNNITELTTWMNLMDTSGNWALNANALNVVGGHPATTYGNLKIIHQTTWVETVLNPNTTGIPKSTLVEVPMGNIDNIRITIRDLLTCCEETVLLKRCAGNTNSLKAAKLNFSAYPQQSRVVLEWATKTGYQNDYFMLEKSTDGTNFEALHRIENKDFSNEAAIYSDIDTSPSRGLNYYRIKQVYLNGAFDYTTVKKVAFHIDLKTIHMYPNPATDFLNINLGKVEGKQVTVRIMNNYGQIVKSLELDEVKTPIVQLPINDIVNGLYQVLIKINGRRITSRKLIVNRMY